MSTIESFYNKTLTIRAKAVATGSKTTGYTTVASGIQCAVLPVTETEDLYDQSNMGKEFNIICEPSVGIKSGYILDIDGEEYGVSGVSFYDDPFESDDDYYKIRGVKK